VEASAAQRVPTGDELDPKWKAAGQVEKQEYDGRWDPVWKNGLPPGMRWDIGQVAPSFDAALKSGEVSVSGQRCLVPGCGRGYDLHALVQAGASAAVGLDLSSTACQAAEGYLDSTGLSAEQRSKARLECADFFTWSDPAGAYDMGYDYTFGCAIHPSMRTAWAQGWARQIKSGGQLVTLVFPTVPGPTPPDAAGPPYPVNAEIYRELLTAAGFEEVFVRQVPPELSHASRQGKEWLALWKRK